MGVEIITKPELEKILKDHRKELIREIEGIFEREGVTDGLLVASQVKKRLNISERVLGELIERKSLIPIFLSEKKGSRRYFDPEQINSLIETSKKGPALGNAEPSMSMFSEP